MRKLLMNFTIINLYEEQYEFREDDPIFFLKQNAPRKPIDPAEDKSICRLCKSELTDNDRKQMKACGFCGYQACKDCSQAKRRLPLQLPLPNAKDEAPRSICCKLCLRKLLMMDAKKKHFV